jgi:hypothetical protein
MTKLEMVARYNQLEGEGSVTPALIDQLIKDGTIPPQFITKDGRAGKLIHLAPATFAVVILLQLLQAWFGEQSPLPKRVVRELIPKIQQRWMNPQMEDELVFGQSLEDGRVMQVKIRPTFISKARALVA